MERSKRAPYEVQIKELEKTGQAKFIEVHNIFLFFKFSAKI